MKEDDYDDDDGGDDEYKSHKYIPLTQDRVFKG